MIAVMQDSCCLWMGAERAAGDFVFLRHQVDASTSSERQNPLNIATVQDPPANTRSLHSLSAIALLGYFLVIAITKISRGVH